MSADRIELNRKVNKLYRQLGKEIYETEIDHKVLNKKQVKLIKAIEKSIKQIEKLRDQDIQLASEALILDPEKNEDGFYIYKFCPHCNAGNNPKSTHCMRCNERLSEEDAK